MQIENSLLRPTIHDDRYDNYWTEEWDVEEEEEIEVEPKFKVGDVVTSEGIKWKVVEAHWDRWGDCWQYECEPIEECEWAWAELFERDLSA